MGLLDDAIREHLELKRRHGADPDEVSRQEREALGAPVRGEFAKPAGDAAPAEAGEAEGDLDVAEAPPAEDEADAPPVRDSEDELEVPEADFLRERREPAPPFDEEAPEPAADEPRPGTEEDPWLVEDLADEEPEPPSRPDAPPPGAAASPEGEDVLEETPEFLQETPEHDRLWFEQKPPRDFDWDK